MEGASVVRSLLAGVLIFVFCSSIYGQNAMEGKTIVDGKIRTTDSQVVKCKDIVFKGDEVEFHSKNSRSPRVLRLDQIDEILEYRGRHERLGVWIGGILGFGAGAIVAWKKREIERTGFLEETKLQPLWLLPFTVGGLRDRLHHRLCGPYRQILLRSSP